MQTLAEWAGERRICDCGPHAFAYLDIETTGLAGGTGTFAFLVGVGKFTQDGFHLAQFFMRDPLEEPAQLLALEEFIAPCQTVVTYNGKSFDVPLLNTRYILQGWKSPLVGLYHIDLLQLARRLWRDRLASRTLGNVETFILGAHRTQEDIPGWMVPQMYFDYLHTGDARPLKGVFYHNEMDVVALAALLNYVSQMLEDPLAAPPPHPVDLIGMGKMFEDLGRINEAVHLYRRSLDFDLQDELLWQTIERLSFIYKRQGDYASALALWEQAAQHGDIYAHVELAKYHEHQRRDVDEAARWTRLALAQIHAPSFPRLARHQWLPDLEHRLERLVKKGAS
jgi:uncharacterized protein YprB with RNaseH-like and TPR domain